MNDGGSCCSCRNSSGLCLTGFYWGNISMEETHAGEILSSYTTYVLEALLFNVVSVVTYWYFLSLCIRFNFKLMSYWSLSIGRAQVVSGINKGSNCGYHTYGCFICVPYYSTTWSWAVIIASHYSRVHTEVVKENLHLALFMTWKQ